MKDELPKLLANQAQNFFVASFTKQGWDGQSWKEVKRRQPGTSEYKYPKTKGLKRRTNPILIGSGYSGGHGTTTRGGTLRRKVSNSIKSQTFQSVRLVVDLPYAAAQNDGVPAHNLPRRHYMGNSPVLSEMHKAKIVNYVNKLF